MGPAVSAAVRAGAATGVLALAYAVGGLSAPLRGLVSVLIAAYTATLVDGAEQRPDARYNAKLHAWAAGAVMRWMKARGLGPEIVFDVQLEPDAQRIFAIHPHGVMSFCHAITYCAPAMLAASPASKRRALGASAIYAIPIVLACGGVSASREPANRCLKKGYSLTIVPGGER